MLLNRERIDEECYMCSDQEMERIEVWAEIGGLMFLDSNVRSTLHI